MIPFVFMDTMEHSHISIKCPLYCLLNISDMERVKINRKKIAAEWEGDKNRPI